MALKPNSVEEMAQIVTEAAANATALRIIGGGSKSGLGNPVTSAQSLTTTGLSGIVSYQPDALALTVQAGTPLAEIEQTLAAENQRLAFEPADYRALFGTPDTVPTIGGITACNISGPRRLAAGACRDFLLGVKFINGRGEQIKNGGKVMKNVTGYDLVKLQAGSYGTLGILTELSFKTAPLPETEATLEFSGLSDAQAIEMFSSLLGHPLDITGANHLNGPEPKSWLRIEGFDSAVKRRIERVRTLTPHPFEIVMPQKSTNLWTGLRDLAFATGTNKTLWKLNIKPSAGPALVAALQAVSGGTAHYDWGGARIWYCPDDAIDSQIDAHALRNLIQKSRGHAMLVCAPDAIKNTTTAFHPQPKIISDISEKIRAQFDPHAILNPGLMAQGEG